MALIPTVMIGVLVIGPGGCIVVPTGVHEVEVDEIKLAVEKVEKITPEKSLALVTVMGMQPDDSSAECLNGSFRQTILPTKVILPEQFEAIQKAKNVPKISGELPQHTYYNGWLKKKETQAIIGENKVK